ncbi:MAG: NAD-dependent epimerase/dehydratase family protein, partial [Saprospiraceae bacterium]|nr:NAD-dependent epimerase/dehydratase family protein [Saprospiraceae bacterium]
MQTRILILGSNGQIGTVLSKALMDKFGLDHVICSDIRVPAEKPGQFIQLDILDTEGIKSAIDQYQINTVYHLAALLSANGEKNPA